MLKKDWKQFNIGTKGWDLSESGKQKPITHFLLKIQILNREWLGHLPMNSWNRKSSQKIRLALMGT